MEGKPSAAITSTKNVWLIIALSRGHMNKIFMSKLFKMKGKLTGFYSVIL